ncbi:TPA_asm: hypothetical protein GDL74_12870 [Salmonella enterica]|nr:hypothetical protein [Salmonella enterica subsp. houtenae serovar 48:g,z51:-]EAW9072809.1 hypothetical protein [Salmonella enterica]EAX3722801.1 hypothetical protein [Salmonella enterica]EAZ7460863.1 hypothetical protein [Salmonella enterica]EBC7732258.1 hypothetical protein [Salmonella enterica]
MLSESLLNEKIISIDIFIFQVFNLCWSKHAPMVNKLTGRINQPVIMSYFGNLVLYNQSL